MHRMAGYHRQGWGRGWGGPYRQCRGGWGFLPLMFLGFFLLFGLLKFLWPLLLMGAIVALFTIALRGHKGSWNQNWGREWRDKRKFEWNPSEPFGWSEKRKNDIGEKSKRQGDDRRFTTTPDGDLVEII